MDMIMGNVDQDLVDELTGQWVNNNTDVTQINWNSLYQSNYLNNVANPDGSAKYVLEERHNDLMTTALNSVYSNQINRRLKLTAGVEANYSRGMHYKTMNDLLGGNQWIDIDQFAERDFTGNMTIIQNDLRNPNRKIVEGDRFGYDYNMHIVKAGVFAKMSGIGRNSIFLMQRDLLIRLSGVRERWRTVVLRLSEFSFTGKENP